MAEVTSIHPADLRAIENNLGAIHNDLQVIDSGVGTINSNVKVVYDEILPKSFMILSLFKSELIDLDKPRRVLSKSDKNWRKSLVIMTWSEELQPEFCRQMIWVS